MIWILLVVFQIKHFLADYLLQTPYMLGKFKDKGWITPLACHCLVQSGFTLFISLVCFWKTPGGFAYATLTATIDFWIHFVMDRIKASPKLLGRYESLSKEQFKGLSEARQLAVSAIGFSRLSGTAEDEVKKIDAKFRGNKYFWWSLGLDQMVHHLTDILIVYLIVTMK